MHCVFPEAFVAEPPFALVTVERGHEAIASFIEFAGKNLAVNRRNSGLVFVLLPAPGAESVPAALVEALLLAVFTVENIVTETAFFRACWTQVLLAVKVLALSDAKVKAKLSLALLAAKLLHFVVISTAL